MVLVATALTLNACDTPANRRELYNTSEPNGVWHDYARQREAEADLGLPPGSTGKTAPIAGPTTPMPRGDTRPGPRPRTGPLQADPTALPSANTVAPNPTTTTTTVSPAAAPNPVTPGESVPTGSSSEAPAPPAPPPQ